MFWKKTAQPKQKRSKADQALIKPSRDSQRLQEKRVELTLPCYLYVEATGYLVQTTTISMSKNEILVKSLRPLETGQEILCVISDRKNLTSLNILHNKNAMKGKVVRVEQDGILYRMDVIITLGRVNPFAFLGEKGDGKYWWTRSWQ